MGIKTENRIKTKRNGEIEFWRAVFCMIVFIYHISLDFDSSTTIFKMGQIGVEFFFLISGLFMARSIDMKRNTESKEPLGIESLKFVIKKYVAFFPYHLFVFVAGFIFYIQRFDLHFLDFCEKVLFVIPQFFLVHLSGMISESKVVSVEWYLSGMLIAMLIMYPLIRKFYDMYDHIIAPLSGLAIMGMSYVKRGTILGAYQWDGITTWGVFRAIFLMNLGCIAYEIAKYITAKKLTSFSKITLSLLCLFGYMATVFFVNFQLNEKVRYSLVLILMFSVAVSFSGINFYGKIFDNGFCRYIGKLTLPMYLNTNIIRYILVHTGLTELRYRYFLIVAIALNFALSAVLMFVVEKIIRNKNLRKNKHTGKYSGV